MLFFFVAACLGMHQGASIDDARQLLKDGKYEQAEVTLASLIKAKRQSPEVYVLHGYCHMKVYLGRPSSQRNGDLAAAVVKELGADNRKASNLDEKNRWQYVYIPKEIRALGAETDAGPDLEFALRISRTGVANYPDDEEIRLGLVESLEATENHLEAGQQLDILIANEPGRTELIERKADDADKAGNYQAAVKTLTPLVAAGGARQAFHLYRRAVSLDHMTPPQTDEAIADLDRAIQLEANVPHYRSERGHARFIATSSGVTPAERYKNNTERIRLALDDLKSVKDSGNLYPGDLADLLWDAVYYYRAYFLEGRKKGDPYFEIRRSRYLQRNELAESEHNETASQRELDEYNADAIDLPDTAPPLSSLDDIRKSVSGAYVSLLYSAADKYHATLHLSIDSNATVKGYGTVTQEGIVGDELQTFDLKGHVGASQNNKITIFLDQIKWDNQLHTWSPPNIGDFKVGFDTSQPTRVALAPANDIGFYWLRKIKRK